MQPHERILVALDVDTLDSADGLIRSTAPHVGGFKVGKELMFAAGPGQTVAYVQDRGGKVFMDGKFHTLWPGCHGSSQACSR